MYKKRNKTYDRVMPRVYNNSQTTLRSNSLVTRHENESSNRVGAKPSVSNVRSSVFSELPTVLNDYVPEISEKKVDSNVKSRVVKPRRTLKSLDTSKSPPRTVVKPREKPRNLRAQGSAPALSRDEGWSDLHFRECYSSRSHAKLKELKDEIKAYHETEKFLQLRSNLYKKCGVVFDDDGSLSEDKAVQVGIEAEKENGEKRRQEWLTEINREDLLDEKKNNHFVCSAHFDDSAIITSTSKRLTSDAVPTKLLPTKNVLPDASDLNAPTKVDPQTSKKLTSHLSNKDKIFVPTYSHAQSQTETQAQKHTLPYKQEIDYEIANPNMSGTVPSEPTTSTSQSHTNVSSKIINTIKLEVSSASTQTDLNENSNKIIQTSLSDKSPRKRKLKNEIEIGKCQRRRLEQEIKKNEKELEAKNASLLFNPEDEVERRFMKLVEWQNKIKNKFKGNRYNAKFKIFASNLFYASPHSYRCLQTVLKLPSLSTLNRLKLKIPPKLDNRILNSLSLKMKSLPDNAKYCTICVDEMVLKRNLYYDIKKDEVIGFHNINGSTSPEIASNGYVIILQGIYSNWKQPIAYALLGSTKHYAELDSWMNEVILELFGVGIKVKAIISDQGSNFDRYAKVIKNVTVEKPYFFINEHKIFYIFDVPHLLKSVRNNLLSSNFHYKGKTISWDHIKSLYEHQKEKNFRLIPKITSAHVEPNNFQRMRVKYAAQIFSNTVSAALDTYIDFGIVDEEARPTSKFIKIMDELFDVLNSSKIKSCKKYQSALRMSADQKLVLQNALDMFATIKSINKNKDNTNHVKTFHNFQITIQSVLQLFEDLKLEGFKYLFTRRLNQDSVEKFFGSIRQQGSCSEPTPIQFTRAFSKLFYVNMLKSDYTNCNSDIYEVLLKAEDIINKERLNPPVQAIPSLVTLNGEIDHRVDLPEANALTYVAGFLLYKCLKKHSSCKEMFEKLDTSLNLDHTRFTHIKIYNPSQEINEYVQKLETVFTHNFEYHLHGKTGSEIFKLLKEVQLPSLPCSCFPIDYLLRLFVRLRIFSTLKFNNRNFKTGKKSTKQYLKVKQL